MKQVIVGRYDLGGEPVIVKLQPGNHAEFAVPFNGTPTVMLIGSDVENWGQLVGLLMHEAKEFCDTRIGCRYAVTGDVAKDNGSYMFVETHLQHSEVCARVGWFLADCFLDLSTAWGKWKKAKR